MNKEVFSILNAFKLRKKVHCIRLLLQKPLNRLTPFSFLFFKTTQKNTKRGYLYTLNVLKRLFSQLIIKRDYAWHK